MCEPGCVVHLGLHMGGFPRLVEPVQNFVMCLVSLGVTAYLVTALASMMFEK
jgi:hypothetical protein